MPITMSPDSAVAASNDHAVTPSNVVSGDTLPDVPEESEMQALAVASGNDPNHFPFMKLAVGKFNFSSDDREILLRIFCCYSIQKSDFRSIAISWWHAHLRSNTQHLSEEPYLVEEPQKMSSSRSTSFQTRVIVIHGRYALSSGLKAMVKTTLVPVSLRKSFAHARLFIKRPFRFCTAKIFSVLASIFMNRTKTNLNFAAGTFT